MTRQPQAARAAPLVSVIVPVRNEGSHIDAALAALVDQDFHDFEIIIVDGESTDDTVELARAFAAQVPRPTIRVLSNPERTVPHALNIGVAAARGRLIVRVDGHSAAAKDYLSIVVEHLRSGAWAGVGGRKRATSGTTVGQAFSFAFASRLGAGGSTYHHGTRLTEVEHVPCGAYPRYVVDAVGGWDPAFPVNQDFEFDHRVRLAGGRLCYDPAIEFAWRCRDTLGGVAAQYLRYGTGKASVVRRRPRSLRPRQLAPPAIVAGTAGSVLLALATGRRRVLAPLALYGAALLAGGAQARGRGEASLKVALLVPIVLATMHFSWGAGFLSAFARPQPEPATRWPHPRPDTPRH